MRHKFICCEYSDFFSHRSNSRDKKKEKIELHSRYPSATVGRAAGGGAARHRADVRHGAPPRHEAAGARGHGRPTEAASLYILSLTLHCHGHIHNHSHYHIHISPRLPAILQVYARYAAFMHQRRITMHPAGHARRVRRKRRKDRTPRAAG